MRLTAWLLMFGVTAKALHVYPRHARRTLSNSPGLHLLGYSLYNNRILLISVMAFVMPFSLCSFWQSSKDKDCTALVRTGWIQPDLECYILFEAVSIANMHSGQKA